MLEITTKISKEDWIEDSKDRKGNEQLIRNPEFQYVRNRIESFLRMIIKDLLYVYATEIFARFYGVICFGQDIYLILITQAGDYGLIQQRKKNTRSIDRSKNRIGKLFKYRDLKIAAVINAKVINLT